MLISIHAPREGGDIVHRMPVRKIPISIHAPREGGDPAPFPRPGEAAHFNPRPPRGGRLRQMRYYQSTTNISIHAPREGGDRGWRLSLCCLVKFQSTPPARGATRLCRAEYSGGAISIHAPREGGDGAWAALQGKASINFNPRPPRGGRLKFGLDFAEIGQFQSTPPARGATSLHRPLHHRGGHFNPRPPRGGRRLHDGHILAAGLISIHAPREGGDGSCPCCPLSDS